MTVDHQPSCNQIIEIFFLCILGAIHTQSIDFMLVWISILAFFIKSTTCLMQTPSSSIMNSTELLQCEVTKLNHGGHTKHGLRSWCAFTTARHTVCSRHGLAERIVQTQSWTHKPRGTRTWALVCTEIVLVEFRITSLSE